jgi:hypothetical protein
MTIATTEAQAHTRFIDWLYKCIVRSARGDDIEDLLVEPSKSLWLGRLTPEAVAVERGMGERGERLDPCAIGVRVRPSGSIPLSFNIAVHARTWRKTEANWKKSDAISVMIPVTVSERGENTFGAEALAQAIKQVDGRSGFACEIRTELRHDVEDKPELTVLLVNTAGIDVGLEDSNLYECVLEVRGLSTAPFILEGLPDSFRYDRRVPGYGINCGVIAHDGAFATVDTATVDRGRPTFWNSPLPPPDLAFSTLARDPLPSLHALIEAHGTWGRAAWGLIRLQERAVSEAWNAEMQKEAEGGAADFQTEHERLRTGIALLSSDATLLRAFKMMNAAMGLSARGKYDGWRPFQMGFILANLRALRFPREESRFADVVWFATGGGKTETYLGIVVTAALLDRLRGKSCGITAWSRFPLRMLSLQQTQRFADALAGAEIVRQEEGLGGQPFSVGFLVGDSSTPNRIEVEAQEGKPDPDDPDNIGFKILLRCPFCRSEEIETKFNRALWLLEHKCKRSKGVCPWPAGKALPFYIVDEEIYRILPTVVVGTLDKAATISMQAAMRGLVGPPWAQCTVPGHGFTYAPRSKRPKGCLVPGCPGEVIALDMAPELFAPTLRLQDELHLLKDSLGAIDAHYEALLDHLQGVLSGTDAKILGSSATLTGYQKQVDVLYRRKGRVFPALGPSAREGFWSSETDELARRFVALAPRGVTVEYAVDRSVEQLQICLRQLRDTPDVVCAELDIPVIHATKLLSRYGVDVVYGNTLRDLDATTRSFETQIKVDGNLNYRTLTGKTPFDEVRETLNRLERPEEGFEERIHLIAASAMMSHGVDVDRLNVLAMIGLPLTTAEFIQTTARVGRTYPGLVLVFPKMARERDAGVYRSFEHFVIQGDRFVEPVPISRRSRRVLACTIAGLVQARILHIHERKNGKFLGLIERFREYYGKGGFSKTAEAQALIEALGFADPLDQPLREDIVHWLDDFIANLDNPAPGAKWTSDLSPTGSPMLSLRDVEEQAPIFGMVK